MKKRKTLLAGAIAVACAMTTLGTAAPAQAKATAWDFCNPGMICLYQHVEGKGAMKAWGERDREVLNVGSDWNDRTSSIWNRSSMTVCFYEHRNLDGVRIILDPGRWADRLYELNDRISSWTTYMSVC
ncbi:hypothetical protein DP939_19310 [Spongiactinospora rosea]|uniref:Peptidase inhibitor family I36 n=1 Tax=Spongiactinospora rosea TaxID=2248750 RepID=A0A366LXE1_9ACTN|nr:peptidase inhibitor family I36 protein [Spongiactinospora rosea]RBQ18636.1 hypothetical protein DP939_19310 [Spongiactinospora rosea]